MPNQTVTGAIILAAGTSERMGRQKLSLLFSKGLSFIEHCANQFSLFGCSKIALVVNNAGHAWIMEHGLVFPSTVSIITNAHPDKGRMFSIRLGLRLTGTFNPVFVHNVDNPFINQKILSEMVGVSYGHDGCYVSPQYRGRGGHPVLLSPGVSAALIKTGEGNTDFRTFLSVYTRLPLEVDDERVLANINNEAEYSRYIPPFSP